MIVYHGCAVWNVARFERALADGRHLYVTDTPERARLYANAQATGVVRASASELAEHAAIVSIDVPDSTTFLRRSPSHTTLDVCETTITSGRIVSVERHDCDYKHCTCHKMAMGT